MNHKLINRVKKAFSKEFHSNSLMIFSPGRINIIGEHTDYNDGYVFPAAVDKGIVAAFDKSSDTSSKIIALDLDESFEFEIDSFVPQREQLWTNYILGVIDELSKREFQIKNFNLVFAGDIPNGAGMSSSAALENSVVFGLNQLFELGLSKEEMIFISQKAEHNYVGVHCGIMDQYASILGLKDQALHLDCRSIKATPFKIDLEDYQFLLINTNVKHILSESAYNNRREVCEYISSLLGVKALRDVSELDLITIKDKVSDEDFQKALFVIQENKRTIEATKAMLDGKLKRLGELMYASHHGLQHQYQVSCKELDFLVDATRDKEYLLGARMMGGGFGGCTINIIKTSEVDSFNQYIKEAYFHMFNIQCSIYDVTLSDGTHQL